MVGFPATPGPGPGFRPLHSFSGKENDPPPERLQERPGDGHAHAAWPDRFPAECRGAHGRDGGRPPTAGSSHGPPYTPSFGHTPQVSVSTSIQQLNFSPQPSGLWSSTEPDAGPDQAVRTDAAHHRTAPKYESGHLRPASPTGKQNPVEWPSSTIPPRCSKRTRPVPPDGGIGTRGPVKTGGITVAASGKLHRRPGTDCHQAQRVPSGPGPGRSAVVSCRYPTGK